MIRVETTRDGLRSAIDALTPASGSVGFVPTMGALHAGHLHLVASARRQHSVVVVSIFVNPTQFGAEEDFDRYPRALPADLAQLEEARADLVFAPSVQTIYPSPNLTEVSVRAIAGRFEGALRHNHFTGVATVVAKLLLIVHPHAVYLGQKDAQQVAILRAMIDDLFLPVALCVVPTVRAADGLALSSRNAYLTPAERQAAPVLYRALCQAAAAVMAGERSAASVARLMAAVVANEPLARLNYAAAVDPRQFHEVDIVEDGHMLIIAAQFGATHLIDNLPLILTTDSAAPV